MTPIKPMLLHLTVSWHLIQPSSLSVCISARSGRSRESANILAQGSGAEGARRPGYASLRRVLAPLPQSAKLTGTQGAMEPLLPRVDVGGISGIHINGSYETAAKSRGNQVDGWRRRAVVSSNVPAKRGCNTDRLPMADMPWLSIIVTRRIMKVHDMSVGVPYSGQSSLPQPAWNGIV